MTMDLEVTKKRIRDGWVCYPVETVEVANELIAEVERLRDYAEAADGLIDQNHTIINEQEAEVERLQAKVERLTNTLNAETRYSHGEYWVWQDDGEDYPESLTCLVLVQAEVIRRFVAAEAEVEALEATLSDEEVAHQETLVLVERLRKILSHVPARIAIKAKEDAGFGTEIKLRDEFNNRETSDA